MKRIIVDSGSSIKQDEKEKYGVEIAPLRISIGENEYIDGIDLDEVIFYDQLINHKVFPKTSLPSLDELDKVVSNYIKAGDEVIIVTISSGISGTYQTIKMLYEDNKNVLVIDSKSAVGGIKIIVKELNKIIDKSLEEIDDYMKEFVNKIEVIAIPETLTYLKMGGRLSSQEAAIGNLLHIKPLISIKNGKVYVKAKKIGIKKAMSAICEMMKEECDTSYPIVPSYTFSRNNLNALKEMTDESLKKAFIEDDSIDLAIAAHWGPNAFGYIYVRK